MPASNGAYESPVNCAPADLCALEGLPELSVHWLVDKEFLQALTQTKSASTTSKHRP
jgi:hypothetical protein